MHLTDDEERALEGEQGEALAAAYRVLVAVGEMLEARRLIPIASAHLSGVNYANLGDAGLDFLEEFSSGARVSVRTTVNPCGADLYDPPDHVPADFLERQRRIRSAYLKMGCGESFSCTPYEAESSPPPGSHVSWAESSAAVYANSVMGLYTNRESGLSALAAAVAGRTPEGGMHLEGNRRPGYALSVDAGLEGPLDYQVIAYYAASRTSADVIAFVGLPRPPKGVLKLMAAAVGAAGSSSMFTFEGTRPEGAEADSMDEEALRRARADLMGEGPVRPDGAAALLGCPFYGSYELSAAAVELTGVTAAPNLFVQTSDAVYGASRSSVAVIAASGARVMRGACYTLAPSERWTGARTFYTDSVKAVHYLRKRGVEAYLRPAEEIIRGFAVKGEVNRRS